MKIERLIEEALLLGKTSPSSNGPTRGIESPHMHGQALRKSADATTRSPSADEALPLPNVDRRASVLEELRRQSGVFFDDEGDGEETDLSEEGADPEASESNVQKT